MQLLCWPTFREPFLDICGRLAPLFIFLQKSHLQFDYKSIRGKIAPIQRTRRPLASRPHYLLTVSVAIKITSGTKECLDTATTGHHQKVRVVRGRVAWSSINVRPGICQMKCNVCDVTGSIVARNLLGSGENGVRNSAAWAGRWFCVDTSSSWFDLCAFVWYTGMHRHWARPTVCPLISGGGGHVNPPVVKRKIW